MAGEIFGPVAAGGHGIVVKQAADGNLFDQHGAADEAGDDQHDGEEERAQRNHGRTREPRAILIEIDLVNLNPARSL